MIKAPKYKHDDVAVYLGDCYDLLQELEVQADLILTSPPYDTLRQYGGQSFDFEKVADACVMSLKPGGVLVWVVADAVVDGSETGSGMRQALGFMDRGLRLHDTMIYEKMHVGNPTPNRYLQTWEYMFVLSNGKPNTFNPIIDKPNSGAGRLKIDYAGTGRSKGDGIVKREVPKKHIIPRYSKRSNVWPYFVGRFHSAEMYAAFRHPAIFPLTLARDHVFTWTNPGDLVLDPMAGSGTTLRAAKNLGRKAVGIEIHEEYIFIIKERLAQHVMALEV